MADEPAKDWILPAAIPFAELKGKDLEECLYWLFDAMGAKDLEWRTGGSGGGAADGGRDLEAHFFTPGADNEIEPQVWWIECKGRSGTVESDEVKSAVTNAQAKDNLDYIVIATNTQFSNPTRDWVKDWQQKYPRPKIKLWDSAHLECLLSRHPEVALRLFSQALSIQGLVQGAGIPAFGTSWNSSRQARWLTYGRLATTSSSRRWACLLPLQTSSRTVTLHNDHGERIFRSNHFWKFCKSDL